MTLGYRLFSSSKEDKVYKVTFITLVTKMFYLKKGRINDKVKEARKIYDDHHDRIGTVAAYPVSGGPIPPKKLEKELIANARAFLRALKESGHVHVFYDWGIPKSLDTPLSEYPSKFAIGIPRDSEIIYNGLEDVIYQFNLTSLFKKYPVGKKLLRKLFEQVPNGSYIKFKGQDGEQGLQALADKLKRNIVPYDGLPHSRYLKYSHPTIIEPSKLGGEFMGGAPKDT